MTGPELIVLGHAAIAKAHELILLGGGLGFLSILAGLISRRVGAVVNSGACMMSVNRRRF
jgi:hypothetical protein